MKSIGRLLGAIVMFPVRALLLPVESFLNRRRRPEDHHAAYRPKLKQKSGGLPGRRASLKKILLGILKLPILLIEAPFVLVRGLIRARRTDLLILLPPVLMIGFWGFVFYGVFKNSGEIENRYRRGTQAALESNDLTLAKTYFSRIAAEQELTDRDRLNWAIILSGTGELERSQQILSELAPDDKPGYAPAHRMRALAFADQLKNAKDPLILRKLRAQLEFCGDNSPQINQAWAQYYLAIDQTDTALGHLQAAAETDPRFLILIANVSEQSGRRLRRDRALRQAEAAFGELVAKDPLDSKARVTLANVQARLGNLAEAERTLKTGLKLQPEIYLRNSTADYYLMRYDLAAQQDSAFREQFAFLQKALGQDENYLNIYDRLIKLYRSQANEAEAESIKKALMETATEKPTPMAHLALSNLFWLEGNTEEAQWHAKKAYEIDPKFSIVLNNLAWMLAHQEAPDLEQASTLIKTALETAPADTRFLDTFGTVLLFQEKYEEAITAFQKALPGSQISGSIHEKLANCYREIGKPELAELHQQQALKRAKNGPPEGR